MSRFIKSYFAKKWHSVNVWLKIEMEVAHSLSDFST